MKEIIKYLGEDRLLSQVGKVFRNKFRVSSNFVPIINILKLLLFVILKLVRFCWQCCMSNEVVEAEILYFVGVETNFKFQRFSPFFFWLNRISFCRKSNHFTIDWLLEFTYQLITFLFYTCFQIPFSKLFNMRRKSHIFSISLLYPSIKMKLPHFYQQHSDSLPFLNFFQVPTWKFLCRSTFEFTSVVQSLTSPNLFFLCSRWSFRRKRGSKTVSS